MQRDGKSYALGAAPSVPISSSEYPGPSNLFEAFDLDKYIKTWLFERTSVSLKQLVPVFRC